MCRLLYGCQSEVKKNLKDDLWPNIKKSGMPISITLNPNSSVIGAIVIAKNKVKSLVYSGGIVLTPKLSYIKLIIPDITTMMENHFIIFTR